MSSQGPWRFHRSFCQVHGPDGELIATVHSSKNGPLLAASWGLARAAEDAAEFLQTMITMIPEPDDPLKAELQKHRDALAAELAKVKGVKP